MFCAALDTNLVPRYVSNSWCTVRPLAGPLIPECNFNPAQAGARKVYAVEASAMAKFARQLADSNPDLGSRIEVINGKVEEVQVPEKVSAGK